MADRSLLRARASVFRIEPMTQDDVPEVSRVERRCFANPWPASAYRRELRAPEQNYYVVLRDRTEPGSLPAGSVEDDRETPTDGALIRGGLLPRRQILPLPFGRRGESDGEAPDASAPPILGFAGMWILYDEAHITTIGVDPTYRGRGLGELLLVALFDEAIRRGSAWLTLEVRVSNTAAQQLYLKYGFGVQGTRRRYYSDNNEDAYIMWSPSLRDPDYLDRFAALRRAIHARAVSSQQSAVSQPPVAFGTELTAES